MNSPECIFFKSGSCVQGVDQGRKVASVYLGSCPYDQEDRLTSCAMSVVDVTEKTAMREKRAAWVDVKAKAEAIVATGGVVITRNDSQEVDATVMSRQVAPRFPVSQGGPYDVILSKRSWENQKNVGGWLQAFLCSCEWGNYHSGTPGSGFSGRMCSHSFATLIVANVRAKSDYFGDRTASKMMNPGETGRCQCGNVGRLDLVTSLCEECVNERAFYAMVARLYSTNEDERREAVAFLQDTTTEAQQRQIRESMSVTSIGSLRKITSGKHKAVVDAGGNISATNAKSASRIFSQEEIDRLQDENLGQLARNHDRYQAEDKYQL